MAKIDHTYHKLLGEILAKGFTYEDPNRKGINRIQIPSYKFEHDFENGFPAITTKKLYWKGVVGELLWFLRGDTNIKYLVDNNIPIWNKDAYNYYLKLVNGKHKVHDFDTWLNLIKNRDITNLGFEGVGSPYAKGPLGRVYGSQWRNFRGKDLYNYDGLIVDNTNVDQISNLVKGLKENPIGTRHIVTAWNPAELDQMALPPCHWSFEILVEPIPFWGRVYRMFAPDAISTSGDLNLVEEELNKANIPKYKFTLKWHQRSVDTFLGLPFNIASYALLAHIIGKMVNMVPKGIEGDLSNVHIYEPHLDAVKQQLGNDVDKYGSCDLKIDKVIDADVKKYISTNRLNLFISRLNIDDFKLNNYKSYPKIEAEMLPYNK